PLPRYLRGPREACFTGVPTKPASWGGMGWDVRGPRGAGRGGRVTALRLAPGQGPGLGVRPVKPVHQATKNLGEGAALLDRVAPQPARCAVADATQSGCQEALQRVRLLWLVDGAEVGQQKTDDLVAREGAHAPHFVRKVQSPYRLFEGRRERGRRAQQHSEVAGAKIRVIEHQMAYLASHEE